ncbi:MAG: hypothetical protein ACI31E_06130 [Muribaculaceae bacterium]
MKANWILCPSGAVVRFAVKAALTAAAAVAAVAALTLFMWLCAAAGVRM